MSDPIINNAVQDCAISVLVQEEDIFTAVTSIPQPVYVSSLQDIGDIDVTSEGKADGSVLVYKANTNKWTATTLLNQQVMDAGEF